MTLLFYPYVLICALFLALVSYLAHSEVATTLPQVNAFISDMVARYGFAPGKLQDIFAQVELRPEIITAMTRPAESKPWFEYRKIFINPERINGGVAFWDKYQDALNRAEARFGVDPTIIVAIIGVETRYGAKMGNYRVMDALTTLAFQYPRRAQFFRGQLEEYLLLTRKEGIDPLSEKGSYAGAMGMPQFMPSSFRDFAVDFDGDGRRDLWNNPSDAIGSVANYLRRNEWQPNALIASATQISSGSNIAGLINTNPKPNTRLERFKTAGVRPVNQISGNPAAALLRFEGESAPEYWLCFQNFYAITRYNHSPLYALAVYQLSQEIQQMNALNR